MIAAQAVLRALPHPAGPHGRLAHFIAALTGWRRRGVAVLLGAIAALALPPVGVVPVLLLCIPGLIWLMDGSGSRRAAFGAGWWWGLGFYTAGYYWIAHALLIEPEKFGWMVPFATIGLGGFIALFLGAATLCVRLLGARGAGRVPVLAGAWTVMEWVKSWIFTGFPWNPLGSVWDAFLPMLQGGAVLGAFGLSALTVLIFGLPAMAADLAPRRRRLGAVALAIGLFALGWGLGSWRLATTPEAMVPGIRLRLVQAAVQQQHKWREDLREAHLREQLELSLGPGFQDVTHVIWPETAAPFFLDLDENHRAMVAAAAPPGGLVLTGAPRVTPPGVEPFTLWNSLVAVNGAGEVAGLYDKVHLVPFGEYVPLRAVLPIAKVTHGATDFSPGPGLRTLSLPGLPTLGPLICYEAIFPAEVVGRDQQRPAWLLHITNDGWFGMSAGPYQHLAASRLRAVEEGLPMVRVANTGISAVFDGAGREIASLGLGHRGVIDAGLPQPLDTTPFARLGNLLALAFALVCALLGLVAERASRHN